MKILIITGTYAPETGGIAELLQGFAKGLIEHGNQVRILAGVPGAARFSSSSTPVTEFDLRPRGYLQRISACRSAFLRLAKETTFDRVIASSWSPFAVGLPATVNGRRLPVDILCHGMDLLEASKSFRYRVLMKRTLRRAARIIANSRYTRELARSLGAPEDNLLVLPPGVDSSEFSAGEPDRALLSRYQIPSQAPVIISLGRLIQRKGFDLVIRALPQVLRVHPCAIHLIVGDGPDRERLLALARNLGVANNVRYAGPVPVSERCAHYRLASVFVMPNRLVQEAGDVEGFGIVFLEAACCELPAIGGKSGGVSDAIEDGVTGYLIDPARSEDCAQKIITLISNQDLRGRLGRAARMRACTHFSWPAITARYLTAIE